MRLTVLRANVVMTQQGSRSGVSVNQLPCIRYVNLMYHDISCMRAKSRVSVIKVSIGFLVDD